MNGTNLIEYYKIVEACRNLVRGEIEKDKSGIEYVAQVQKRRRKKGCIMNIMKGDEL